MPLSITLENFEIGEELSKIPELVFDEKGDNYWILLPVFERFETITDKLIDLGEAVQFDEHDTLGMLEVVNEELEALTKVKKEETLMETDQDIKEELLRKIQHILNLAQNKKVKLITKV